MADNSWMGDEPLKTTSSFAPDRTAETPFCSIRRDEDLEVVIPSTSDIVCSQFPNYSFPMYEVVFKDVGFRLSFIDFQREVFRWTKLSPPPPAFELVCQHLEIDPSKNLFFTVFIVQQGVGRGGGSGWVFFRQKEMFGIFAGKVRS